MNLVLVIYGRAYGRLGARGPDPGTLGTLTVKTKRVFLHGMVLAGNVDDEVRLMVIQYF